MNKCQGISFFSLNGGIATTISHFFSLMPCFALHTQSDETHATVTDDHLLNIRVAKNNSIISAFEFHKGKNIKITSKSQDRKCDQWEFHEKLV